MQTLKLFVCASLILAPFVAYADSMSCANVSRWNSDKTYKQGDRVWYRGFSALYQVYSCDKAQCKGAGQQPSNGDDWKAVGHCDKAPSE